MAEVVLENVSKTFGTKLSGQVEAVRDFNLTVADKEFVVFVGPSGCGKSTTLRMIAGLEEITQGSIYINGQKVNDKPSKDRDIAMVFQNYALFPHMTVYENMAFPLTLRKRSKPEIDDQVRAAAAILGIEDLLKRKPKALSGGQRQRVAIGRAIVRQPQVFLMDEPLSNLDAKLRNQMRAEIIKLRQRVDTTFIYVTHDQTEAMTLGDRIVVMKDGLIQQVGTPQQVYNQPANLFVAGFIGAPQMNFFPARLDKEGEEYRLFLDDHQVELTEDRRRALERNQAQPGPVTLGIRPDCLRPALPGEAGLPAQVGVTEMLGSSLLLHAELDQVEAILMLPVMELDRYQLDMSYGAPLSLHLDGDLIHLFAAETEESLLITPAELEA